MIVAGGRARRFGSEKALAQVEGQPMIAQVAKVLQPACEALAVNARTDSGAAAWAASQGLAVLPDPPGAEGPLAGVIAGLQWAEAAGAGLLATAPCDTPWLPADLVLRLAGALTPDAGCAVAAVGHHRHPLCALWRVEQKPVLRAALAGGARHPPLHRLAAELGAAVAQFDDARAFANINTAADLKASPA